MWDALQADAPVLGTAKKERAVTARSAPTRAMDAFDVAGSVWTTDGQPVEGAVITLGRREAVSGPDGTFRATVEETGTAWLRSLTARPQSLPFDGPTEELDFVVAPLCPLEVTVLGPDGPVAEAEVGFRLYTSEFPRPALALGTTDRDGQIVFPLAQCGRMSLSVEADGLAVTAVHQELTGPDSLVVTLQEGVRVHGHVTHSDGSPVPDGTVRPAYTQTQVELGPDGDYELRLTPGSWKLYASAHEHNQLTATRDIVLVPGQDDLRVDFVIETFRSVEVYCAGLPEDSCGSVFPVMCTSPLLPIGEECRGSSPTQCACPPGEAAIRGGGQSAQVLPGDEAVWLDFRATGAIEGVVTRDGEPFVCRYGALQVPEAGMDLLGGGLHARSGRCDSDGTFQIAGLGPGRWAVEIYSADGRWPQDDVRVLDTTVDLGVIDLDDGGTIHVWVVDGLTGEPSHWEPVAANLRGRDSLNPIGAGGMSDGEGRVDITGLADGTYDVFGASNPLARQTVTIVDGSEHDITLTTGDGTLLDEQGFQVATDDRGDLVVTAVEPDGGADRAGLTEGDVLLGVAVAGVDVLSWAPSFADQATRWVLENTSGAGVVLVVERDDGLVDIPL